MFVGDVREQSQSTATFLACYSLCRIAFWPPSSLCRRGRTRVGSVHCQCFLLSRTTSCYLCLCLSCVSLCIAPSHIHTLSLSISLSLSRSSPPFYFSRQSFFTATHATLVRPPTQGLLSPSLSPPVPPLICRLIFLSHMPRERVREKEKERECAREREGAVRRGRRRRESKDKEFERCVSCTYTYIRESKDKEFERDSPSYTMVTCVAHQESHFLGVPPSCKEGDMPRVTWKRVTCLE